VAIWASLLRAHGPLYGYLVYWSRAVTLAASLALIIAIAGPYRYAIRLGRRRLPVQPGIALVMAGLSVLASWRLTDSSAHFHPDGGYTTVTAAADAVERLLPIHARRVLACVISAAAWPTSAGVVADLAKHRLEPRVNRQWLHVFGEQLAPTGRETVEVFLADPSPPPSTRSWPPGAATFAGGLIIHVFAPRHGYVSVATCPAGH
jgi:hypothetical protein